MYRAPSKSSGSDGNARMEAGPRRAPPLSSTTRSGGVGGALAGVSAPDAAAIIAAAPEIAEFSVDYHPAWLPQQMPNNAGRIQFEMTR